MNFVHLNPKDPKEPRDPEDSSLMPQRFRVQDLGFRLTPRLQTSIPLHAMSMSGAVKIFTTLNPTS